MEEVLSEITAVTPSLKQGNVSQGISFAKTDVSSARSVDRKSIRLNHADKT